MGLNPVAGCSMGVNFLTKKLCFGLFEKTKK